MYWRNYGCKQLKMSPVVVKSYYVSVNPDGSDNTSFKRKILNSTIKALEITYYLQAVQCDIEKGSLPVMGSIMKRIIVPDMK